MKSGAPGRIRTVDLVLRRHTLYPSELRAQSEIKSSWCDCITFCWGVAMEWRWDWREFRGSTDGLRCTLIKAVMKAGEEEGGEIWRKGRRGRSAAGAEKN